MESWYWWLTIGMALLGIGSFTYSWAFCYDTVTSKLTRPGGKAFGMGGLLLMAWAVLLAVVGGVVEIARLLS